MISAYAVIDGKRHHFGTEPVLSRWHVAGCANCQTNLEAKAFIGLSRLPEEAIRAAHIEVEVHTRDGLLGEHRVLAAALPRSVVARKPFHFEVR